MDQKTEPISKRPAHAPGVEIDRLNGASGGRKIARRLLAALGDDLVVDLLAFHQRAHAGAFHRADMHEHVFRAVGRLDESETLLGIEELHGTCRHHGSPCVATPVNPTLADRTADKASEFWGNDL